MAASLQPDPAQVTPASSEPSINSPTPQPESSSQPIQPTNQQPSTPTETAEQRYTRILEDTVRESNQRIQAQQDELVGLRRQAQPATPTQPQTPDASTFFNDPAGVLSQVESRIKAHLDATVKPLQDFVRNMKGDGTPYGNLKNQFANDPQFSRVLANPKISVAVDKILENAGVEVNRDMMAGAIMQAAGMEQVGQLDSALARSGIDIRQFAPTPAPTPEMRITPPHVAPTPPAAPTYAPSQPEPKQYTENEKRLMRERKMTPEEWEHWLALPANEVVTSKKFGGNNG